MIGELQLIIMHIQYQGKEINTKRWGSNLVRRIQWGLLLVALNMENRMTLEWCLIEMLKD